MAAISSHEARFTLLIVVKVLMKAAQRRLCFFLIILMMPRGMRACSFASPRHTLRTCSLVSRSKVTSTATGSALHTALGKRDPGRTHHPKNITQRRASNQGMHATSRTSPGTRFLALQTSGTLRLSRSDLTWARRRKMQAACTRLPAPLSI